MSRPLSKTFTNSTACGDGYFKVTRIVLNIQTTKQCLQNIFQGDFPDALLKIKKQYLAGNRTANGSGTATMCPIGENGSVLCRMGLSNDDHGGQDCADQP